LEPGGSSGHSASQRQMASRNRPSGSGAVLSSSRARGSLDRHAIYIVAAYLAGAAR